MQQSQNSFSLLRWFGVLSLITITGAAIGIGAVLSHFLADEILDRHASQTAGFVSTVAEIQSAFGGFSARAGMAEFLGGVRTAQELGVTETAAQRAVDEFFDHMRALPSVLSVDVYARTRAPVWSFNKGRSQLSVDNQSASLERIFSRQYANSADAPNVQNSHAAKIVSDARGRYDVRYFVPLLDSNNRVAAVVQISDEPTGLFSSIRRGRVLVWTCSLAAGALTYLILFWVVRRAAKVIQCQQRQLVESERLAVVGELALAVAHGIRSPLAAIRSSAELAMEKASPNMQSNVRDIVSQTDRLNHWLRDLLVFSVPNASATTAESVDIVPVLEEALDNFRGRLGQRRITPRLIRPEIEMPAVMGNRSLFLQVFNSIIANAIDAMADGGSLTVRYGLDEQRSRVVVDIADTGAGMSPEVRARMFMSFNTTKARGLGVGLTLVKRVLERYGGGVRIESVEREGTRVELDFAACAQS